MFGTGVNRRRIGKDKFQVMNCPKICFSIDGARPSIHYNKCNAQNTVSPESKQPPPPPAFLLHRPQFCGVGRDKSFFPKNAKTVQLPVLCVLSIPVQLITRLVVILVLGKFRKQQGWAWLLVRPSVVISSSWQNYKNAAVRGTSFPAIGK